MDRLFKGPNRVLEKQKAYQTAFANHVPPYLIPPRSNLYYRGYLALWFTGLAGTAVGFYSLIKGKQTEAG